MNTVDEVKTILTSIYEDLFAMWQETQDFNQCVVQLDVEFLNIPIDSWIHVINFNLHFYNGIKYEFNAYATEKKTFTIEGKMLNVRLLDFKIVDNSKAFTGSLKA